jgi:hypothetical protein
MKMNQRRQVTAILLTLVLSAGTAAAKTTTTKHTSSHSSSSHKTSTASSKHSGKKNVSARSRGQHSIGEERTREIQAALIREHYLSGDTSGKWDQESKEAMVRYQAANGWQTKVVPDSRALIKLGLGPDHKGLLNPDTAAVASPHELGSDHVSLPGGSAQP